MTTSDPRDESLEAWDAHGPPDQPPNREPGTREHPHASRPRRDLEDRASVDGQEDEGREHLYGHRTLDGQAGKARYFGNPARGHQARKSDSRGGAETEPSSEPERSRAPVTRDAADAPLEEPAEHSEDRPSE